MQLRLANEADIPQLIEMRLEFLSEDYGGLTEEQERSIKAQLPDYFRRHLNRDLLAFVCEADGHIVSTILLLVQERPANPSFITGLTGTILNVYTIPVYRRRGIAERLLKMAIREAERKNLSYIELKATQSGEPLYRRLGFAPDKSQYTPMKYVISRD